MEKKKIVFADKLLQKMSKEITADSLKKNLKATGFLVLDYPNQEDLGKESFYARTEKFGACVSFEPQIVGKRTDIIINQFKCALEQKIHDYVGKKKTDCIIMFFKDEEVELFRDIVLENSNKGRKGYYGWINLGIMDFSEADKRIFKLIKKQGLL